MRKIGTASLAALIAILLLATLLWLGREPLARLCVERAHQLSEAGDRKTATSFLKLALLLDKNAAGTRLLQAWRLQFLGDFEASQAVLATIDEGRLEPAQRFHLLTTRAVNALRMARLDDARADFGEAIELAKQRGDRGEELALHVELGRMHFYYTHNYERSLSHLEEARNLAAETGHERYGAEAATLLGQLLWWWKGEVDDPLPDYFEPALEVFQRRGDRYNEADTLHKIAFFHANDGNLLEFFKFQGRGIAIREELGDRAGLAHEYLTLGWAYLRLHDYRRAQRFLEKSIEVNADRGDLFAYLRSQRVLADCELRQGFVDEAQARLERTLDRDHPGVQPEDPFLWAQLGEVARRRGQPLEARRHFRRALEVGKLGNIGRGNRVWMLSGLSYSYIATGALDKAEEVVAEIAELVAGMHHWGSIRRLELQRADLAEARGEPAVAFRALLAAEEIQLRSVAASPVASDTTNSTHERLLAMLLARATDPALPPLIEGGGDAHAELAFELLEQRSYGFYRDLVVLSVGRRHRDSGQADAALAALRKAARLAGDRLSADSVSSLREAYGSYEDALLQRALSDENYSAMRRIRPPGLAQVRERIGEGTALLQFVLADGKAFCLVLRSDGLRVVALPSERRKLAPKIRLFHSLALEPKNSAKDLWRPIAGNLFELLIEPIQQAGLLHDVRRLGIIPYGDLYDLPFAALLDAKRDRFLIEDFDLFLLPAASLMGSSTSERASDEGPTTDGVFAVAIQNPNDDSLAPLPFATQEAEMAVAALGGRAVLQEAATETSLKTTGNGYRYLHLATHGISEPRMPLLSHLVLQPSDQDDGRLTVGEIFALDVRAELVVLAGCQTGLSFSPNGSRRGPVGRLGLIQAFLHSGARSVLASLAPVSDRATLVFMRAFYAGLSDSPRATALAEVQRAMATGKLDDEASNLSLRHPRHWAPFILVGAYR